MHETEQAKVREKAVLDALALLRDSRRNAGASMETALATLAAVRRRRELRTPLRRLSVWAAAAAIVFFGAWLLQAPAPVEGRKDEIATEFIPLAPGPLLDPQESLQVLRIEVPRSGLRRFGLPALPEADRGMVQADVLIGPDGVARAVRFVHE